MLLKAEGQLEGTYMVLLDSLEKGSMVINKESHSWESNPCLTTKGGLAFTWGVLDPQTVVQSPGFIAPKNFQDPRAVRRVFRVSGVGFPGNNYRGPWISWKMIFLGKGIWQEERNFSASSNPSGNSDQIIGYSFSIFKKYIF